MKRLSSSFSGFLFLFSGVESAQVFVCVLGFFWGVLCFGNLGCGCFRLLWFDGGMGQGDAFCLCFDGLGCLDGVFGIFKEFLKLTRGVWGLWLVAQEFVRFDWCLCEFVGVLVVTKGVS
jgi:hypothetical protein